MAVEKSDPLIAALQVLDPILQFLTKSTGHTSVSLQLLKRTIPVKCMAAPNPVVTLEYLQELTRLGVLCLAAKMEAGEDSDALASWDSSTNTNWQIGFPEEESLRASTKTAAKRRLAALKRKLKAEKKLSKGSFPENKPSATTTLVARATKKVAPTLDDGSKLSAVTAAAAAAVAYKDRTVLEPQVIAPSEASETLKRLFGEMDPNDRKKDSLHDQFSYAGSFPGQESVFADLSPECERLVPPELYKTFGLKHVTNPLGNRLYQHQAHAIESALLRKTHTAVCTGTGSGKSLCFWIPVLSAAAVETPTTTSLVLFPTKALAQDQLKKLNALLSRQPELAQRIRPAALDGDTPQSSRAMIAASANVILTNPDTLHAAILPNAKEKMYADLLSGLRNVVLDEAHVYSGAFGSHVAFVLRRLLRVVPGPLIYLAASATLPNPDQHFRRLCPIAPHESVSVIEEDFSPRAPKHFYVQNPPLLLADGTVLEKGAKRPRGDSKDGKPRAKRVMGKGRRKIGVSPNEVAEDGSVQQMLLRRHAADETALLLVRAVRRNVRCIVFCKTRNLVEWVYERASTALKKLNLAHLIESYRGGYSRTERREIEAKLFGNKLLGVVATNALELGVDVGGVDVTVHCGYPSSYASVLQQAGRAGRGANRLPSLSIMVCFNSAAEQHMWRHPSTLLGKGVTATTSVPLAAPGIVQGHMLCASNEIPLTGGFPASVIRDCRSDSLAEAGQSDWELFGGKEAYQEASQVLLMTGSLVKDTVSIGNSGLQKVDVFRAHYSMQKAWTRVSIRSIEPISYGIVDISHGGQGGRMDAIHDEAAVMDTIPYSRVFYHAHPGAIITHRGHKYKVVSMTPPPAFVADNYASSRRSLKLGAFAKPTQDRYTTRPLSNLYITVIKRIETVEIPSSEDSTMESDGFAAGTIGGCGYVGVKRTVHGYKKLSLITRAELSRTELSLPPMEYDTFGVWLDAGATELMPLLGDKYGIGVHALSHAILAVAPLVCPGLCRSDLQCDHAWFEPTCVMLFDERAGGSGACQSLWSCIFKPNGLLEAAIQLLEECSICQSDTKYDGGCPECLHDSGCIKFNMHLSRSAAIGIGKWMLARMQQSNVYKEALKVAAHGAIDTACEERNGTPRRRAREKALRNAKEMQHARDRQIVVGRPSWPLDSNG